MTDNGSGYCSKLFAADLRAATASGHCGPGPIGRKPTGKPNASSRPCYATGPTQCATRPAHSEHSHSDPPLDYYNNRRPHGIPRQETPSHTAARHLTNVAGIYN